MSRLIVSFAIFSILFAFSNGLPAEGGTNSKAAADDYEHRVMLLTGDSKAPLCNQNKADLGECLKRVFTIVQKHIVDGVPELNIPRIEPFKLNRTVFQFDVLNAKGRLLMKSAEIYGMSDNTLKTVDFKVDSNGKTKYHMTSFLPKMSIVGTYKADVMLNTGFHFKPRGTFNVTLTNVDFDMRTEGEIYEKDGHKFARILKLDANPKIGDLDLAVTGIFEDPELNELAMNIAKQSWREVYRIMLPETRDYWAPLVMRLMNEALSLLPYDSFVESK